MEDIPGRLPEGFSGAAVGHPPALEVPVKLLFCHWVIHVIELPLPGNLSDLAHIFSFLHDWKKLIFLPTQGSGNAGWVTGPQDLSSRVACHGSPGLAAASSEAGRRVCQERRFPPSFGMVFPPLLHSKQDEFGG